MYVIDTNIFIDWWERRYPPDVFPSVQRQVEGLVSAKKMCAPQMVQDEINHVASLALRAWASANRQLFLPHDAQVQQEAASILNRFPGFIDPYATYDEADRWVIALAKCKGYTVVTHETSAKSKRRPPRPSYIPDVCLALTVPCIDLVGLMRREKWAF